MNIAVDIDEVIAQFSKRFIEYYNIRFCRNVELSKMTRWHFWQCPEVDMTEDEFSVAFRDFNNYRMWQSIEPFPDACDALCSLDAMGHRLYYLTSRPSGAGRATMSFLLSAGFPVDGFISNEEMDKAKISKQLEIDIAIDDKPENIKNYVENKINVAAMVNTHNCFEVEELKKEYPQVNIVNSLKDFVDLVVDIKQNGSRIDFS